MITFSESLGQHFDESKKQQSQHLERLMASKERIMKTKTKSIKRSMQNERILITASIKELKNSIVDHQAQMQGVSRTLNYPSIPEQEAQDLAYQI